MSNINIIGKYEAPRGFSPHKFAGWLARVGNDCLTNDGLNLERVLIEAMDAWEEQGHYELSGQFTLSGNPEIFGSLDRDPWE